jgi:hypothetical protein
VGWEGKSDVEASRDDADVMEARRAPANSVVVAGPAPYASARGVRPECFEKHVVWVAHRKTGSVLESRVKRSRRPIGCVGAIPARSTFNTLGGRGEGSIETSKTMAHHLTRAVLRACFWPSTWGRETIVLMYPDQWSACAVRVLTS